MGRIVVDATIGYKRVYRPTICDECILYDDSIGGWCPYYKSKADLHSKPEFCHVISVTVEEES